MEKWEAIPFYLLYIIFSIVVISSFLHYNNNGFFYSTKNPSSQGVDPSMDPTLISYRKWMAACTSPRIYNASLADKGRLELQKPNKTREEALKLPDTCDLFSGRWVHDNESSPLYRDIDCPYLSHEEHKETMCEANGRPDLTYQRWRWQPHDCDLKRWNATRMLEKLRGKRMRYVGDSLNRVQWISMVCMLQAVIPERRRSMTPYGHLSIFKAEDYNATVEFHWSPYLVDSNQNHPFLHGGIFNISVIRPDTIAQHAAHFWKDVDILIFDSFLWWITISKLHLLRTEEERWTCEQADGLEAMKLALNTWADWIEAYVDVEKQRVFFTTASPVHDSWDTNWESNCQGAEDPIGVEKYESAPNEVPAMMIVDGVLRRVRSKVSILNITQLSMFRRDAHISIYSAPEKERDGYSDCIHWCLPGLPDVWNQLLFQLL